MFPHLKNCKQTNQCVTNPQENSNNASILLKYANGSTAVINYFSNGSKSYAKERIEVFSQERTLVIDNWRKLTGFGFKGFSKETIKQDKGHFNQFKELIEQQQKGKEPIIRFKELVNTTRASFAAIDSLKQNSWVSID